MPTSWGEFSHEPPLRCGEKPSVAASRPPDAAQSLAASVGAGPAGVRLAPTREARPSDLAARLQQDAPGIRTARRDDRRRSPKRRSRRKAVQRRVLEPCGSRSSGRPSFVRRLRVLFRVRLWNVRRTWRDVAGHRPIVPSVRGSPVVLGESKPARSTRLRPPPREPRPEPVRLAANPVCDLGQCRNRMFSPKSLDRHGRSLATRSRPFGEGDPPARGTPRASP